MPCLNATATISLQYSYRKESEYTQVNVNHIHSRRGDFRYILNRLNSASNKE